MTYCMTVGELLAKLAPLPRDAVLLISNDDGGPNPLVAVLGQPEHYPFVYLVGEGFEHDGE